MLLFFKLDSMWQKMCLQYVYFTKWLEYVFDCRVNNPFYLIYFLGNGSCPRPEWILFVVVVLLLLSGDTTWICSVAMMLLLSAICYVCSFSWEPQLGRQLRGHHGMLREAGDREKKRHNGSLWLPVLTNHAAEDKTSWPVYFNLWT